MKAIFIFSFGVLFGFFAYSQTDPAAKKALDEGILKYRKEEYSKALELFTKAITLDPACVNAYIYRGLTKDAQKNFPAAISDFNRARKLDTNDVFIYFERAQTFLNMDETEAAVKDFEKVIELSPGSSDAAESYLFLARIFFKSGDYDKSVSYFNTALGFRPRDPELLFQRGEAKFLSADHEGAIKDFSEVLELDVENEQAFFYRGEAKVKTGDDAGACQDFKKAKLMGDPRAADMIRAHCKK